MAQHGSAAGAAGQLGSTDVADDQLLSFLKSRIDQPSPAAGPSLRAPAAALAAGGAAGAAALAAGAAAGTAAAGTGSFAELERELGSSTVVDFRDIQFIRLVGGSAFGKTYLARLHECDVACKVLLSAVDPSAITGACHMAGCAVYAAGCAGFAPRAGCRLQPACCSGSPAERLAVATEWSLVR